MTELNLVGSDNLDYKAVLGGQANLLIIDDEEEILKALFRQFRRDYKVFLAHSAEEGFRLMTETPIHVIISDQRMPGITGAEFFGKIKTEFPDAMRLLLTGYADIHAVIAAINDGNIFRYIPKPWDPVELETIVREAFQRCALIIQNRRLVQELRDTNALLEQRVAERTTELADMNDRLKALNTQKDAFLGMAAHDLRTPITVIQGFSDLLLHPKTPREDTVQFVQIIREMLDKMRALLDDILDITAIESGKLTLRPAPTNIEPFVERVTTLNRFIGDPKGILLITAVEPDLPVVNFDPLRIEQVLNNLLSNAFKFSHSDTQVTLSVHRVDDGVEFCVADQGLGIPEDEIEKVFGEFQRVSTRPTANETSTGLGLSICRRIIHLHNGQIGVTSRYGEGSRFYFTLPL
ncbi:MAG: hybrid sensor histidine kinase/response regulator [Chloroflexi bacterium]|nr:hybrid sensor histidine kinase/response regulator [Chloroflexota bacterium]